MKLAAALPLKVSGVFAFRHHTENNTHMHPKKHEIWLFWVLLYFPMEDVKSVKLFLKPFSGKIISKEYTFNSEHEIRLKYYFVKSVKLFFKVRK